MKSEFFLSGICDLFLEIVPLLEARGDALYIKDVSLPCAKGLYLQQLTHKAAS